MVPGAKRRRLVEEEVEDEERVDRISRLPDGVLGDIVSLLPTMDGARTQVLSSRWRHVWRSAPLSIDVDPYPSAPFGANQVPASLISRILSEHRGPGRRFSIPDHYLHFAGLRVTSLDGWLRSPALDGLQELEFHHGKWDPKLPLPLPLPAPVHRFASTLRVASFGGCGSPDGNRAGGLHFPVLEQLSLSDVRFSESYLRALLAACPVLQSLLLTGNIGCSRVQIVCPTLRSIGVHRSFGTTILQKQIIIEDAPCLQRLLCFDYFADEITISVISAPELVVLGPLCTDSPRLEFGTTVVKGSDLLSFKTVVQSVKILSLTHQRLSLDAVIEFVKCFPCLEKLYIKSEMAGEKNAWRHKYKNLIGTLDIRLKKIVLAGYRGNTSHVNFVKFFVLNARMLESVRLELFYRNPIPNSEWIDKQHRLLQMKNKASRDMQLDFLSGYGLRLTNSSFCPKQVHDLSTADPFP